MKRLLPLLLLSLMAACSGTDRREPVTPTIVADEPKVDTNEYSISRTTYEGVLKEGMQHVMRWYFVEPHYRNDRFVGFAVKQVLKEELQAGPLRIGDVLLTINGGAIERPEHAMAVWRGLWPRKTLELKLLRNGKPTNYTIPIVTESE
jgi:type II secretory pathway component PulC